MLTLENLPLYWRFTNAPSTHPTIPERYNFSFHYDRDLSLFIEPREPALVEILNRVYQENANIGYMIDGHNLAHSYGIDYLSFLERQFTSFSGNEILDVGCGGCLLLENLRDKGASVLGVDPSPIARVSAEKKGINLVNDFFYEGILGSKKVDAITQMDVLEHVFDPVSLLRAERGALASGGRIFINVPNCESSLAVGDISMAIHQHVNMYTRRSLSNVIELAGLYVEDMECSKYGSAIFCSATPDRSRRRYTSDDFVDFDTPWEMFFEKAQQRIESFSYFHRNYLSSDVGYFVFQRALPYLAAIGSAATGRIFDNNSLWHGKYLDGVPSKIENQTDFLKNPTEKLLIFSRSFGAQLKEELTNSGLDSEVYTQQDVFSE